MIKLNDTLDYLKGRALHYNLLDRIINIDDFAVWDQFRHDIICLIRLGEYILKSSIPRLVDWLLLQNEVISDDIKLINVANLAVKFEKLNVLEELSQRNIYPNYAGYMIAVRKRDINFLDWAFNKKIIQSHLKEESQGSYNYLQTAATNYEQPDILQWLLDRNLLNINDQKNIQQLLSAAVFMSKIKILDWFENINILPPLLNIRRLDYALKIDLENPQIKELLNWLHNRQLLKVNYKCDSYTKDVLMWFEEHGY